MEGEGLGQREWVSHSKSCCRVKGVEGLRDLELLVTSEVDVSCRCTAHSVGERERA